MTTMETIWLVSYFGLGLIPAVFYWAAANGPPQSEQVLNKIGNVFMTLIICLAWPAALLFVMWAVFRKN